MRTGGEERTVKRLFWLALGAVVGVLVVRRLTPTAAAVAADARVGRAPLGDRARREAELRAALGIEAPSPNGEAPARSEGGAR